MSVTSAVPSLVAQNVPREFLAEGTSRQPAETRQIVSEGQKTQKPHVISSATADLEKISLVFNKKLQFMIDRKSNEVIIKVIDKETDKVIKVLPPEELQRLHNDVKELIGFLFDEKV